MPVTGRVENSLHEVTVTEILLRADAVGVEVVVPIDGREFIRCV